MGKRRDEGALLRRSSKLHRVESTRLLLLLFNRFFKGKIGDKLFSPLVCTFPYFLFDLVAIRFFFNREGGTLEEGVPIFLHSLALHAVLSQRIRKNVFPPRCFSDDHQRRLSQNLAFPLIFFILFFFFIYFFFIFFFLFILFYLFIFFFFKSI